MIIPRRKQLLILALVYAVGSAAGALASVAGMPLPWMIAPMLSTAALSLAGVEIVTPRLARALGQCIVAASVAIAVDVAVLATILQLALPILTAAILTIVAGCLVAVVLTRLSGIDPLLASLASIPGGPLEMAILAERYGVPAGPVAFVQTLRIAFIVLSIPPVLLLLGSLDATPTVIPARGDPDLARTSLMLVIAFAGSYLLVLSRMANPFFLGPLIFVGGAAAFDLPVAPVPYWVLAGAQILLGAGLGATFTPELIRSYRRFIPSALLSTFLLISGCSLVGLALAWWTGLPIQQMLLATAPGAMTEMVLTARELGSDLATVTAFHVTRLLILVPVTPLLFLVLRKLRRGRADEG